MSDPVDGGFVDSMARPGGNVTGFTSFEYSIGGKWLELLKEATPSLRRVLVVLNQENYTSRALLHTITALAPSIGVQLSTGRVRSSAEIKATIETFGQLSNGAVIILPDPLMTADRERIAALAISQARPSVSMNSAAWRTQPRNCASGSPGAASRAHHRGGARHVPPPRHPRYRRRGDR